jgi:beta-glucosidase
MNLSPRKGMTEPEIAATIDAILREATLEEKVAMMSGRGFFKQFSESGNRWGANPYRAGGGCERLGVPALYFTDGPRGVARGNSTCFPCTMARGASFDLDLERRIGEIMGVEARAQDCTLSGAVCMNLLRHPAWGRAQETYGEDPHHLGEMGAALARGIQTHNVAATVKHFALNSMENARFKVDVIADERTMHEVYLPHFKRALDAGCATVMSAYNKLNGEYCGENRVLLTDILRTEWGFDGFVHSDWVFGVHKQYAAAAGLDVENPEPLVFGEKLVAAVQSGAVEPQAIDQACKRILTVIYRFAAAEDPLPAYTADLVACDRHRAVALEAAEKSAVLLTNDGTLPLKKEKVHKLAVLGRLASLVNTGDFGSSRVRPPYVVTPLEGLTRYLGEGAILTADESDLAAARVAAKEADASVVVVGYTAKEEGEFVPGDISLGQDGGQPKDDGPQRPIGGDRDSLELPPAQVELIKAAAESGKPVIVVVIAGSAVIVESWLGQASAILQTFYSGMEGGTALARLLFGDISPSGKLPFTVAKSERDYPHFDKNADRIEYGYYHGYALFEREGRAPRFAFGHGLSYTRFAYRALKLRRTKGAIEIAVSVTNEGASAADDVVQIYASFPGTAAERPKKVLKAFARMTLAPGETKTIRREVSLQDLMWRDAATHSWKLESGRHTFHAGGSSQTTLSAAIDL